MKYVLATILSVGFFLNICYADEKLELKDQKDKESYSLGYQFGQTLKAQGMDINLDVYMTGIRDALGGKGPLMSEEEIRAILTEVQKRVMATRQRGLKEKGEKNLAESRAFLEENKKKEGVKTLPSGLQYKVLVEGSGKTPKATDTVTVHYRGTLINGVEFDSSYKKGQPSTFQVNGVIRGWSEGLQLMKEGSKWQLFIPPELAYGERAVGKYILPYSTLIIEVDLISIK
jgi:FKBP-type peptidyl-prolyl cis-trans isomerase FklB